MAAGTSVGGLEVVLHGIDEVSDRLAGRGDGGVPEVPWDGAEGSRKLLRDLLSEINTYIHCLEDVEMVDRLMVS